MGALKKEVRRLDFKEFVMLGWWIVVVTESDKTLARWNASVGGLSWFDSLVERGQAEVVTNNGYPITYKTLGKHILQNLIDHNIPSFNSSLVLGDDYIRKPGSVTDVFFNDTELSACDHASVIIIEAWDQS
jgi:hypothetical protein